MTWSFPPTHVVQDTSTDGVTNNTDTPPLTNVSIVCGGTICLSGKTTPGGTALLIADALAMIPDVYDWYTVALAVSFPPISQGSSHCGTPPAALCPGDEDASSGGTVNCDLVEQDNGSTVTNAGGSINSPGPSDAWLIGNPDLGVVERTLVVNPTPLFPVPDGTGNTSGQVLWTRDQLLAVDGSLRLTWEFFGTGEFPTNIGVAVAIDPYNDTTPPPPPDDEYMWVV